MAKRVHGELGRVVDVASGVHQVPGSAPDVDDVAVVGGHIVGEKGTGDVEKSLHVGVDHFLPVVDVPLLYRIQTARQARVVITSGSRFASERSRSSAATASRSRTSSGYTCTEVHGERVTGKGSRGAERFTEGTGPHNCGPLWVHPGTAAHFRPGDHAARPVSVDT